MARPWACLGHTDATRARTHGLHDMCGVHPVAATARGLVWPTPSPSRHEGVQALCGTLMHQTPGQLVGACYIDQKVLIKDTLLAEEMMMCASHYLGSGWLCKTVMDDSGQLHNHQAKSFKRAPTALKQGERVLR
uniref:Uncharacterized protein n=1 Tax=Vitis vinifera TaxID=29760 RepID=A5AZH5_VITVI|nr:hypothetical protein VITISV_033997 [Vitis vinifera]